MSTNFWKQTNKQKKYQQAIFCLITQINFRNDVEAFKQKEIPKVLHIYFLGSPILWILRKIFELKSEIFRQKLFTVFDFFSLKWESMCSNSWFWFWKSRKKFPKYSTICSLVRVLNTLNLAQTKISKIIEICGQKLFTVFDFFSLKWESMCQLVLILETGHIAHWIT